MGKRIWLGIPLFWLIGLLIYFCAPGYTFSSYIAFGCGMIAVCYFALHLLQSKKPRVAKILRMLLYFLLAAGFLCALIAAIPIATAMGGDSKAAYDYIIVLGAGVDGTTPSLSLRERLNAAYDYLIAHPDTVCVVSGSQGYNEDISEAECMYRDLTARGIAADRIWKEDKAENTRQNIAYSLDLIESHTGARPEKAGIVSSDYHLYRAGLFAKEQNLESIGIPARTSWISLRINYFLREIAAVWYVYLGG